ncbi:MAG: mechanosensitive ion channel family protein [Parvularculaceae bacterium]
MQENATPVQSPDQPPIGEDDSVLDALIGTDELRTSGEKLLAWAGEHLMTFDTALQGAILIAALVPATLFGPQLKRFISSQVAPRAPYGFLRRGAQAFAHIATPIALYIILQVAVIACGSVGQPSALVEAAVSLLTAWIVIRLVTLVIRSPLWSRVAFYIAWPLAALDAFGVLDDVVRQLDAFSIPLSTDERGVSADISALDIVRAVVVFVGLFWLANLANRFLKGRIKAVDELTPSLKALLEKVLDILAPVIALLIALQLVGFNLATLTIFGGALGLGVGLGLQRTISNFVAGFTLIADKSIKPGDVVEVEDTFGWVTQMNARYVSIRTRDGTEHLIPNDKFIEGGVVNWSYADRIVRLHAGVGVSYNTRDLASVKKICEETALTIDRVLNSPKPQCNLMEFGDSSVNFDLRFWINDPANGISNVRSNVLLAIWDELHEAGVEIPFPQRDIHIKSLPANSGVELAAASTLKAATQKAGG